MTLSSGYAVRLYVDSGSDTLLTGIESMNLPPGIETSRDMTAGKQYPATVTVTGRKPRPRFTSYNVDVCLSNIGLTGLVILSTVNPGLEFYKLLLDTNGQPKSGSVHTKITVRKGLVIPTRISASHQQHAMVENLVLPVYDGTNAILTTAGSAALPGTWADTTRFGLGAVTLGGVSVTQITNLEIDLGVQAETFGGDGDLDDTDVEVSEISPELRITGRFVNLFTSSLPLDGLECTHANTTLYLRRRLQTAAGYVADVTTQHIKMTAAGLAVWDELFEVQGSGHGQGTVRVPLVWDGSNAPITFDTASAIS